MPIVASFLSCLKRRMDMESDVDFSLFTFTMLILFYILISLVIMDLFFTGSKLGSQDRGKILEFPILYGKK